MAQTVDKVEQTRVLARRYRSRNFDELIGQEPIAQTLKNAVKTGRLAHAFLFTGTRGVGKTSAARILAMAIECPNARDGQPCGECPICKAIYFGKDALDVIEIDGASNNGVDHIRELRQKVGIAPMESPYKVYIIDEVHMVTTSAFNALLKTLEEPPEHVIFIFATTDVHKLPATILSRCQRFDFKNIPTPRIAAHLADILTKENLTADSAALLRIARLGNGSMRDALSLLDRVLSVGKFPITEAILDELLGTAPIEAALALFTAIADGNAAGALEKMEAMLAEGRGPERVVDELTEFARNVMLAGVCGEHTPLLEMPAETKANFGRLAKRFDTPSLVHMLALCEQTARNLKGSAMGRALMDALAVRLALSSAFGPIDTAMEAAKEDDGATTRATVDGTSPSHPSPSAQKKNDIADDTAPDPERDKPAVEHPRPAAAAQAMPTAAPPSGRPRSMAPTGESHASEPALSDAAIFENMLEWLRQNQAASIVTMLNGKGRLLGLNRAAGVAQLEFPSHLKGFATQRVTDRLTEAVSAAAGARMRVELSFTADEGAHANGNGDGQPSAGRPNLRPPYGSPPSGPARPAAASAQGSPAKSPPPSPSPIARVPPAVVEEVRNHPLVKKLVGQFNGHITAIELLPEKATEAAPAPSAPVDEKPHGQSGL